MITRPLAHQGPVDAVLFSGGVAEYFYGAETQTYGDIALGADTGLRRTGAADDTGPLVVTLTGCLERSDKEFRLNETTGANAPKARSWKSGFLTKRSASVALVPAGAIPLASHVGRRVTVTGTLVDREMRVRALRRVAASCDDAPRVRA